MLSKSEWSQLIPHQGAMCLLDRVQSWDGERIHALSDSHTRLDNPLRSDGLLRAVHLCEYGAQAMAVHGALLAREQGGAAQPGLLVALRDVRLHAIRIDDLPEALDIVAEDGEGITLRHPLYDGLRVPRREIAEIRASASRITPLDGIKPVRVDIPPGRQAAACFATNRSLDGSTLKLGTRTVAAGFECATGATAWWKPPPGAGTFFALVAAGAGVPSGQKITFAVYSDGKLAGRSTPLGAGDPPALMRCAVPGTESLMLRIEGTGGQNSNGTWAEPMLLRR